MCLEFHNTMQAPPFPNTNAMDCSPLCPACTLDKAAPHAGDSSVCFALDAIEEHTNKLRARVAGPAPIRDPHILQVYDDVLERMLTRAACGHLSIGRLRLTCRAFRHIVALQMFKVHSVEAFWALGALYGRRPTLHFSAVASLNLGGVPVVRIGCFAFKYFQLTSLVLPVGLISIGQSAFFESRLTSLVLPEGLTHIGASAFYESRLTSLVLPEGLTDIGEDAFVNSQLTSLKLPAGLISIGAGAFFNLKLTSLKLPQGLTDIGEDAFFNSQLTSLVLPAGLISVGKQAFLNSQLTSLVLPKGLTHVGEYAFYEARLTSMCKLPEELISIGKYAFSEWPFKSLKLSLV